jgi:hypothetical protein
MFNVSLGQRPRIHNKDGVSAEGAIQLLANCTSAELKRAFSAYLRGDLNSWGDAPSFA